MTTFRLTRFRSGLASLLLLAIMSLVSAQVRAAWPQSITNGEVVRTVVASNGDIFVAGNFSGEAQFGDFTLNSQGGTDVFVARVSAAGRVLWAVSGGGQLTDTLRGITLDAANNA